MKKKSLIKIRRFAIYVRKNFLQMKIIRKNLNHTVKSEIIVIIQENIEELLIVFAITRCKIPKEILVVFHNGSTYDYHFIIKELAKEFKGNFGCLGENTEKCIILSVPIKKEHDNGKATIYKLKFVDSYRFVNVSLSSLVDNLSEINKKELENKLIDDMRSMIVSLSQPINKSIRD